MTFPPLRPPARDDRGSLMMAMLVSLIGLSMAALLAPIVITQIGATRVDVRRVHTVHAAQAGLDAVMAQIRAADDGAGNGVRASMPCGPLTGSVGGGTAEQYHVSIYYVAFDPQRKMTEAQSWFAANDIGCTTGVGPASLPSFAVAFATGTADGGNRVLRGAYRLRTTNQNIAGGRIHIFRTGGGANDLCMDAGSTTPAAGTTLRMQICDVNQDDQLFAYTTSTTLLLVRSVTAAQPTGMCLDAGDPRKNKDPVLLQPCVSPAPSRQQWRYNSNAQFVGLAADGTEETAGLEMRQPNTPSSLVEIAKPVKWPGSYNNYNSFSPDAAVGPGDAGPKYNQLVNYKQFGRCLDLDGGDYSIGYLIAWPCKPSWNQNFTPPPLATDEKTAVKGTISMTAPAGKATPQGVYCLKSPRSTAAGKYPTMVACTAGSTQADLQWRVFGYTGMYATSYRVLDVDGNCLQPNDPEGDDTEDNGANKVSKIVLRACDETTDQKWNADPNILDGLPLKYLGED